MYRPGFNFPEVKLSEDLCNNFALRLTKQCNKAIRTFREISLGRDVQKFLQMILALWIVSILANWFDFLTIAYILSVMMLTMPLLYEKHEDRVDSYALKAKSKLQKQYTSFDERVLQRLPKVPFLKDNNKVHYKVRY
ncbi:reticulon-like protein B5 [Andrographis paniculata]|uniref:reticulon-like protein B5 n=1 Tax=Andrographis paniculata TaxID=175694 RepID=UPI0021E938F7|nr:reticulon-like protein B5 [Andrographis paniculata]